MKILILNPSYGKNFVRSARWAARSRGRVQRHPDYLATATAVLENEGHEVKLLDAAALNIKFNETIEIAREFKPDLSVIHTTTPSIYNDIRHAEMLKDLGSITVLIGPHASALPMETIRMSGKVDYIVRGEYDYTLRDIADEKDPADILGITYRDGDEIITNKDRPFIKNLDELPFPAWHQIDVHDYFDAGKLYPFITMISGRGCPNNCSFCVLPQVMYGKRYRLRSAKKVVDEIEYDLDLFPDLKEIMFEDDTLTANRKRCEEICYEIIDRNLNKRISWSANARADLNDLELLILMKEAGCRMLVVGFEFGDQRILDNVNKRLTIEQMKEFVRLTKKAGIKIHGCFMIGGPGETKKTAEETIKLAKELKPDTLQFSALTPYPGTEFYNWCKENGYIAAKDWVEWVDAGEQSTVVAYPNLSKDEIVDLVDKGLYKNFYFRPSTWVHHLLTVKGYDDFKRKVKGARSLIGYWWKKRIKKC
ncbi:MAG: B12-binding domain-containing radical SAM protein [Candidatus Neomarinimicrobiota bacterium]|mgnify:CR=1 FL=1|nr:MAG: B12-binding domain-containing radical SAM protein [Candidatus Neomarinimicrobiota bacterium]